MVKAAPRHLALAVLALALAPAFAQARPAVAVAEFTDGSGKGKAEKARAAILKAVQENDAIDVVPYSRVKSFAASRKVKTSELGKPKVLGRIAQAAGAEGAVMGAVTKVGAELKLAVHIYDVHGTEVWTKTVSLAKGELSTTTAQRFAAAIAAAVGVRPGEHSASETKPEPVEGGTEAPEAGTKNPDEENTNALATVAEPRRKPKPKTSGEPEGPEAAAVPPPAKSDEEDLARPDWVELTTDFTFTWRNYQFCPEVQDCAQPTPLTAGMAPVKYSTAQPYGGFLLRADVYPLRFLNNFVRGLGLSVAYGRSLLLKTHYTDVDGVDQVFGSTQERIDVELLYRFYFRLGGAGDGWAGLRGGWRHDAFYVDDNPKIVQSVRSGFYGELDVGIPLQRFLRIEARAALIPFAAPGDTEKLKYGGCRDSSTDCDGRSTQGGGWSVEGGLTSDLGHPEWRIGLQAMVEYLFYGDRYNNPQGTHPEFGRATENYLGFRLGLKTHL